MKIHPDQIEGVRQQEQQKANKTDAPTKAFGDVLGKEVSKTGAAQPTGAMPPPLSVNPLLAPQAVSAVAAPSMNEGQAVAQVEQALNSLESYTAQLGSGSGDLRQAYSALEDFQSGVSGLKDAAQGRPELQGMVDELEVLAMTEQMKFNRGDYH